ncbi:MAG TPA: dTDP-4-dehydrorhamnose reductase [Longimicrobiales bacterium]|nr:dTDP-4-dehydrorhamnose reductase [Longimicrobiales bacterium]
MRILVTGAGGLLGREVVRQLGERGHTAIACDRLALDITDATNARDVVLRSAPDAVLHCAAFTNVDAAESSPELAFRVNVDGTENVARAAAEAGARFMYVSTDYVFNGEATEPYKPDSKPNPLSVYGRSKLGGEEAARLAGDWIVARVSWVYGRGGSNFGSRALDRARAGETLRAFTDLLSVPTWVSDAASTLLTLFERSAPSGVYHANNAGGATWYDFALAALAGAGVEATVEPTSIDDVRLPAARPRYSVMDVSETEKLVGPVRTWSDALAAAVAGGL